MKSLGPGGAEPDVSSKEIFGRRVAQSGVWSFALRITRRGIALVQLAVIARFLNPEDFGLFGIALLTLGALKVFTRPSLHAALIQKNTRLEEYYDTIWTFQMLRGVALGSVLFFGAPFVASFFEEPASASIIKAFAAAVILEGFYNPGVISFRHQLRFKYEFIWKIGAAFVAFPVAVGLAVYLQSAWALVGAQIAVKATELVESYLLHPYRPRIDFNSDRFAELFDFGRWVAGTSILKYFINQGDDIVVGKLLTASSLGLYQVAYRIGELPATEIGNTLSNLTFPAFARIRDDLERLRRNYLRTVQMTTLVTLPMSVGIALLAEPLVSTVLGPGWGGVVPLLRLLIILGAVKTVGAFGPALNSIGMPNVPFVASALRLALMAVAIIPITLRFGAVGAAAVVLAATVVSIVIPYTKLLDALDCPHRAYARAVAVPALASGFMALVLVGFGASLSMGGVQELVVLGLSGAVAYGLAALLFDRWLKGDVVKNIRLVSRQARSTVS